MDSYKKYLALAKELEIPKENLLQWCETRVNEEKEERAKEIEREERAKEIEREERAKEIEREERAREREVRREITLAQEETKRQQIAMESEKGNYQDNKTMKTNDDFLMKLPRMPIFNQESDCLESFLHRFEMQARGYTWPREKWSSALINCLAGEPLKVFYTLAADDANDYDKIKEALLKRFRLTEDGYQEKFCKSTPLHGEDFNTFINRTTQFLNKWLQLANVKDDDFKGLYYLILKNRIYQACNPDLVAFLKERKPLNVEELKTHAENYNSAHPQAPLARILNEPYYAATGQTRTKSKTEYQYRDSRTLSKDPHPRKSDWDMQRAQRESRQRDTKSNNWQHNKAKGQASYKSTYVNKQTQGAQGVKQYHKGEDKDRKKDPSKASIECKFCKRKGHTVEDCYRIFGFPNDTAGAANIVPGLSLRLDRTQRSKEGKLKLCAGKVNGVECSTLRDTGCTTVGIKASLIKERDRLGRTIKCTTFGGTIETYELASVYIESPYYTGRVICCILPNPVADLIIGNIHNVNDKPDTIKP